MMFKLGLVFFLLYNMIVIINCGNNNDKYSSRYDNFDVDKVLSNDRILTNYIKCLMEEGSCTSEGRELKRTLPGALASDCNKCNEKQKTVSQKVIKHLQEKRPRDWERLSKKYDSEGLYKKRYESLLRTSTIQPE